MHPKYHQGSGPILPGRTDEHDLMLLKLGRPAVLGPRIQTLPLPYRCTQPGDQCQVAGWGTTVKPRGKSSGSRTSGKTPGSEGGEGWSPGPEMGIWTHAWRSWETGAGSG